MRTDKCVPPTNWAFPEDKLFRICDPFRKVSTAELTDRERHEPGDCKKICSDSLQPCLAKTDFSNAGMKKICKHQTYYYSELELCGTKQTWLDYMI